MTSNHHGPYVLGYTRATMVVTEGSHLVSGSQSRNIGLSSDRSLQLDSVKLESLVIAHQPWRGEYVPGPCTHRPSSHGSLGVPEVGNRKELPRVKQVTGAKS
jgi:hypothetical protein